MADTPGSTLAALTPTSTEDGNDQVVETVRETILRPRGGASSVDFPGGTAYSQSPPPASRSPHFSRQPAFESIRTATSSRGVHSSADAGTTPPGLLNERALPDTEPDSRRSEPQVRLPAGAPSSPGPTPGSFYPRPWRRRRAAANRAPVSPPLSSHSVDTDDAGTRVANERRAREALIGLSSAQLARLYQDIARHNLDDSVSFGSTRGPYTGRQPLAPLYGGYNGNGFATDLGASSFDRGTFYGSDDEFDTARHRRVPHRPHARRSFATEFDALDHDRDLPLGVFRPLFPTRVSGIGSSAFHGQYGSHASATDFGARDLDAHGFSQLDYSSDDENFDLDNFLAGGPSQRRFRRAEQEAMRRPRIVVMPRGRSNTDNQYEPARLDIYLAGERPRHLELLWDGTRGYMRATSLADAPDSPTASLDGMPYPVAGSSDLFDPVAYGGHRHHGRRGSFGSMIGGSMPSYGRTSLPGRHGFVGLPTPPPPIMPMRSPSTLQAPRCHGYGPSIRNEYLH